MIVFITHYSPSNPYCILLGKAYEQNGYQVIYGVSNFYHSNIVPDILHIQWPEALYRWEINLKLPEDEGRLVERLKWYKQNGAKIVHTIHNIEPHENTNVYDDRMFGIIIEHSDLLVHHGENSISLINGKYPSAIKTKSIVAPHGHYLGELTCQTKEKARHLLNLPLEDLIVLNFGQQRGYKNQKFIADVFQQFRVNNKLLLNVGNKYVEKQKYFSVVLSNIKEMVKKKYKRYNGTVINDFRYIPNTEISTYFNAADVVFLGHTKGLNSGILALAATHSKPVVFPDIGNFREQVEDWYAESYELNDISSAIGALDKIKKVIDENAFLDNSKWLDNNTWEKHVKIILNNIE